MELAVAMASPMTRTVFRRIADQRGNRLAQRCMTGAKPKTIKHYRRPPMKRSIPRAAEMLVGPRGRSNML
jgi:hypothetical protein